MGEPLLRDIRDLQHSATTPLSLEESRADEPDTLRSLFPLAAGIQSSAWRHGLGWRRLCGQGLGRRGQGRVLNRHPNPSHLGKEYLAILIARVQRAGG